jgi:hypothetical protein
VDPLFSMQKWVYIVAGIIILISIIALFSSCGPTSDFGSDDNDYLYQADDVFQYTHWEQSSMKHEDNVGLWFRSLENNNEYFWRGGTRDALNKLEDIQKGLCYTNPLERDLVQEVPCG